MSKKSRKIKEAFISSSTDEVHHTANEYAYVDKVALSTNKFYVVSWLGDGIGRLSFSTLRLGRWRYQLLIDGVFHHEKNHRGILVHGISSGLHGLAPGFLTMKERAFISYIKHMESHINDGDKIIRCLYLLKGIGKILNEKGDEEYVDRINKSLAEYLELRAYLKQIKSQYTPEDLKLELIDFIEREYGIQVILNEHDVYLKGHKPVSRFKIRSINYMKFLNEVFKNTLLKFLKIDENRILSQFVFGIIACFEPIPPTIYFVDDLTSLKNKRLGYCFMRDYAYTTSCFNNVPHFTLYGIWRRLLLDNPEACCQCKRINSSKCLLQNKLYEHIRNFLLTSGKQYLY
jgi:hypothetical protein